MLAKEGTHYPEPVLHAPAFAGAYARWLALISESDSRGTAACEQIDYLHANLEKYDAIDQVEILYAHAKSNHMHATADRLNRLPQRLEQLPAPVLDQLRRLGLGQEHAPIH